MLKTAQGSLLPEAIADDVSPPEGRKSLGYLPHPHPSSENTVVAIRNVVTNNLWSFHDTLNLLSKMAAVTLFSGKAGLGHLHKTVNHCKMSI